MFYDVYVYHLMYHGLWSCRHVENAYKDDEGRGLNIGIRWIIYGTHGLRWLCCPSYQVGGSTSWCNLHLFAGSRLRPLLLAHHHVAIYNIVSLSRLPIPIAFLHAQIIIRCRLKFPDTLLFYHLDIIKSTEERKGQRCETFSFKKNPEMCLVIYGF